MMWGWIRRGNNGAERRASDISPSQPDRIYRVGDVIGGVFMVRRVMEGGLGIVYAVQHREGFVRVLKAPKHQSNDEVRQSFRSEAETWVRLGDHPNVVYAYGVEELAGQLFVIAELVESDQRGRVSLRDYLRSPLAPEAIARWAAEFCQAFEHSLARGLVAHRDIKPENLLIGRSGILRVTDFGIARAMALGATGASGAPAKIGGWRTGQGELAGTPPYMAPEQWIGGKPDFRTDTYAFGIVLHEMSYGHRPFGALDMTTLREQHLNAAPRVPPGIFAGIISRCLSKEPAQRYHKPADLLDDLVRVCREQRLELPPSPKGSDNALSDLENRAHALGMLGKRSEAIVAVRELLRLKPSHAAAWTQLGRLLLETDDLQGAREALKQSVRLDDTRSPAWNNLGVVFNRMKRWEDAIGAFDRALNCDPLNTGAMLNSAEALLEIGRANQAVMRLRAAAEIAPDDYKVWCNLGAVYANVGNSAESLRCYRTARGLAPVEYHAVIDQMIRERLP